MRQKLLAMGHRVPCLAHIRHRFRTHPARVQAGQRPSSRVPFRRQTAFRRFIHMGKPRPGGTPGAGRCALDKRLFAAVVKVKKTDRSAQDPEPPVRRSLPRTLHPRGCKIQRAEVNGRACCNKLHFGLNRLFERRHAHLPQHMEQRALRNRQHSVFLPRRRYDMHAAAGPHVRIVCGAAFPVHQGMPHQFPYAHSFSENHSGGVCFCPAQAHHHRAPGN